MICILLAVDGSEHAQRAAAHVIALARMSREPITLHVLNVQPSVTFADIKKHVSHEVLDRYYREEGERAMQATRALLDASAVAHSYHVAVGPAAETIVAYAREHRCEQIVMGTRGLGAMSGLLLGSVASKVLHLAEVPVTLVK